MEEVRLFLCGDVMTGRGIDQILPKPCDPVIHERYLHSALGYVELAEQANGPIPRPVDVSYIWGDAVGELERFRPHARIINLETTVTCSDDWLPKGINYRMNPANIGCLRAAAIDCCTMANNHTLDWGAAGLLETLSSLHATGLGTAGAGADGVEAGTPAALPLDNGGRVLVFALGSESSGVPPAWAAARDKPGIDFLPDLSERSVERIAHRVRSVKCSGDLVVASIHWGGNWGYPVSHAEARFAHALVERAGVDIFHGHSSHHPRGIEVHSGKLILYGCGDFINDYEGIGGHEEFRGTLGLMYFPTIDARTGSLRSLELVATQIRRFRVQRASEADTRWLCSVLDREGCRFGTRTELRADKRIELAWNGQAVRLRGPGPVGFPS